MGAGVATSFADVDVAGVGVSCEDHAASLVGDSVVEVCGDIVKQLVGDCGCGLNVGGFL